MGAFVGWQSSELWAVGPLAIGGLLALALYLHTQRALQGLTFTAWLLTLAAVALAYPRPFLTWGDFDLKRLIVPVIQLVMFGMGTSVSAGDFLRALKMPKAVVIGMALQYTVMPLTGVALAFVFGFSPEVAAGMILLGSCPGGVASNVMTFLARGNVPLSVTMTACSTLMAPLVTPALMELLAGRLVPIAFMEMMISIIKMIVLPIVAGLIANRLLREHRVVIDRVLPTVAMAGICSVNAIITANSRDKLLTIGLLLVVASILHNFIGYALGYAGARLSRLSVTDSRTVAIEVGMQNGGMAAGLAIEVLRSSSAALAPTIFGTVMNASGAALASWWRGKPVPGVLYEQQSAPKAIPTANAQAQL